MTAPYIPIERAVITTDPLTSNMEVRVLCRSRLAGLDVLGELPPLTIHHISPGDLTLPAFALSEESASVLMAALWNAGIRPKGKYLSSPSKSPAVNVVDGVVVELRARIADQQRHIDDLRHVLGIPVDLLQGELRPDPDRPLTIPDMAAMTKAMSS